MFKLRQAHHAGGKKIYLKQEVAPDFLPCMLWSLQSWFSGLQSFGTKKETEVLKKILLPQKLKKGCPGYSRQPFFSERQGFEPWEAKDLNGFRDRPVQPLRHLSLNFLQKYNILC